LPFLSLSTNCHSSSLISLMIAPLEVLSPTLYLASNLPLFDVLFVFPEYTDIASSSLLASFASLFLLLLSLLPEDDPAFSYLPVPDFDELLIT
jgi:hypothetical protein